MAALSNARSGFSTLLAAGCLLLVTVDVAAVEFVPLGFLDGRSRDSRATGVSGDGRVVVGESGREAFRWTAEQGMVGLGGFGGNFGSRANAASFDGAVVVGQASAPAGDLPFRWTESEGMVALPGPTDWAMDVSADGTKIVGLSGGLWTLQEGVIQLPDPIECCWDAVQPFAISADGSVVVGSAYITSSSSPYRWIEGVGADVFVSTNATIYPFETSDDGTVIVGTSGFNPEESEAFRWTESGGLIAIPPPAGSPGIAVSAALAVSADGNIIAGSIGRYDPNFSWEYREAAVWDEVRGWRRIEDILLRGGANLLGWHLSTVDGISASGRVVVGRGINPDGNTEAWMAVIPEPATLLMSVPLAAFASCVIRNARRSRVFRGFRPPTLYCGTLWLRRASAVAPGPAVLNAVAFPAMNCWAIIGDPFGTEGSPQPSATKPVRW